VDRQITEASRCDAMPLQLWLLIGTRALDHGLKFMGIRHGGDVEGANAGLTELRSSRQARLSWIAA
jgi:hypothetical protein